MMGGCRSGPPISQTVEVGADGLDTYYLRFPVASNYVVVNSDAQARMYFSEEDFQKDEGATELRPDEPFQSPLTARALWFRATANRAVISVLIHPRVGL